jgi:protein subunit release factor A
MKVIPNKDLSVEYYQHNGELMNEKGTGVHLVHLPTKKVFECQRYFNRHQNYDVAVRELKAYLDEKVL